MEKSSKKVCITGGAGYIGSWLVKKLLDKGYTVHATLRNLNDKSKVGLLKSFPYADERSVLFEADIYNPDQFQPAIEGCHSVLHLATPLQHTDNDKYKNTTEAAVEGVRKIAFSCIRSGTVKRLVYTASVVAASPIKDHTKSYKNFIDETCWTPLDHIFEYSNDFRKAYTESKTIAEKEILSYAGDSGSLEIVTLACALVGGETLLPYTPLTASVCVSPLTGNEYGRRGLKYLEHLLEKFQLYTLMMLFFKENYPGECCQKEEYMDAPKTNIKWGSIKLIDLGFQYKYGVKDILDDSVKSARRIGDIL